MQTFSLTEIKPNTHYIFAYTPQSGLDGRRLRAWLENGPKIEGSSLMLLPVLSLGDVECKEGHSGKLPFFTGLL